MQQPENPPTSSLGLCNYSDSDSENECSYSTVSSSERQSVNNDLSRTMQSFDRNAYRHVKVAKQPVSILKSRQTHNYENSCNDSQEYRSKSLTCTVSSNTSLYGYTNDRSKNRYTLDTRSHHSMKPVKFVKEAADSASIGTCNQTCSNNEIYATSNTNDNKTTPELDTFRGSHVEHSLQNALSKDSTDKLDNVQYSLCRFDNHTHNKTGGNKILLESDISYGSHLPSFTTNISNPKDLASVDTAVEINNPLVNEDTGTDEKTNCKSVQTSFSLLESQIFRKYSHDLDKMKVRNLIKCYYVVSLIFIANSI